MAVAAPPVLTEELHPPLSADEALLEADHCLGCGSAHAQPPCAAACPVERWLEGQTRFADQLRTENAALVERIQAQVDADWAELAERCATG